MEKSSKITLLREIPLKKFRVADPGCLYRIPDPNFSIPDPGLKRSRIRIKEFKNFQHEKLFLSSRKNDLGCSSRIPDPGLIFFHPTPNPGSGSATLKKCSLTDSNYRKNPLWFTSTRFNSYSNWSDDTKVGSEMTTDTLRYLIFHLHQKWSNTIFFFWGGGGGAVMYYIMSKNP